MYVMIKTSQNIRYKIKWSTIVLYEILGTYIVCVRNIYTNFSIKSFVLNLEFESV